VTLPEKNYAMPECVIVEIEMQNALMIKLHEKQKRSQFLHLMDCYNFRNTYIESLHTQ